MGFWGSLAGVGAMIGGGVAAFTPGGQALAAPLIGAGASILAGEQQKGAADKAAAAQTQSINQAQGVNAGVYTNSTAAATEAANRANALYAPWINAGASASGASSGLLGLPAAPASVQGATAPLGSMGLPGVASDAASAPAASQRPAETPQARAAMNSASTYGGGTLGSMAGGTVTLRGPDGSVKAVPQSQAQFYVSRGATVLDAPQTQEMR